MVKRIVIVEDNMEYVETLKEIILLEGDLEVVATYYDGLNAKSTLQQDSPDLVLIDLKLPHYSGLELLAHLKSQARNCKFMILTAYPDSELVFEALKLGAVGYIVKSLSIDQIITAIREVLSGGATLSPEVSKLVVQSFWKNPSSPLSAKETEILQLLSEGKTYEGIANQLFNSKETIKWHIKNIYGKLEVDSRAKAIQIAKEKRYL